MIRILIILVGVVFMTIGTLLLRKSDNSNIWFLAEILLVLFGFVIVEIGSSRYIANVVSALFY